MTQRLFPTGETETFAGPERAMPFGIWLIAQDRPREQREQNPDYQAGAREVYHSQKMPPELARRMIAHLRMRPGALICDPFAGTGTTGIEALAAGHTFVGKELEREYVLACRRAGLDVHHGDARENTTFAGGFWDDDVFDAIVTSPPYGQCDPNHDSGRQPLGERQHGLEGSAHTKAVARGAANIGWLRMGGPFESAYEQALAEMRRVLKPGGFALIAVKEFWGDRGLEDLPGVTFALGHRVGLIPFDKIYAMEVKFDEFGRMTSRASMHRHRLVQSMGERACGRGIPAVTTVCVLQRRPAEVRAA